jgi:putative transposase
VKYAAIADWADAKEFPVTFMCDQLGVVRQGYYRWLVEGPCERERTDAELTELIREIHRDLHGHPGVRRVWAELVVRGVRVAAKRVWRLMQAAGLHRRHPRTWKKTTVAGQRPIDAPDLIGQDFTAAEPNTRWCGDITYIQTVDGWVYTATLNRPALPQGDRLRRGRPPAHHPDHRGPRRRPRDPQTPPRRHLPQRPRLPVHIERIR